MPLLYRLIVGALGVVVRVYFRRVEVTGLENVPSDGGGVLVAWHPNGLIDPGLILTQLPRQVIFGARDGLFRVPLLGTIMHQIGTVPIYRSQDAEGDGGAQARRAANQASLDVLAAEVARGSFSCLFPEGTSHDAPHPVEIKTGAARFYYRARAMRSPSDPPPVIIPVGLHYDRKFGFRSSAHVVFHPPLELDPSLDCTPPADEDPDAAKARYAALTDQIERALHETAHATESWELHYLMRRARSLVRAERARRASATVRGPALSERTIGFARVRAAYQQLLATAPESVADVVARVGEYNEDLRALGLQDHEIDRPPRLVHPGLAALFVAQSIGLFFVLPPLVLLGYALNLVPTVLLWWLGRVASTYKKDESTVKILAAMVLYPCWWALSAGAAYLAYPDLVVAQPWLPVRPLLGAAVVFGLGAVSGYLALHYLEWSQALVRSLRVRFTRSRRERTVRRLLVERSALFDEWMTRAAAMALPGTVDGKGRVRET